jgi:Delta3-Delta2-enoyl-CoA isomerase
VALVTTGAGKFFSNGLDLETLTAGGDTMFDYLADCHALLARVLAFPLPTVAAINGHAFAGGGMLALCHDQRVMRSDRGFFCLPEIDLSLPFSPGMHGLITSTLPPTTAREAMLTGRRFGGPEAAAAGIVDAAVGEDEVVPVAVERAAAQAGKPRATLAAMKEQLFADALAALRDRG